MANIINTDSPSKRRTSILKLIVNLLPHFHANQTENELRNDAIAFIILSLLEVEKTISETTAPWEKRGFWSKADHFLLEWRWVKETRETLQACEGQNGWQEWPTAMSGLFARLTEIKPPRKGLGRFWEGSYTLYQKNVKNKKVAK